MQFFIVYITEAHAVDGRSPTAGNGMPIVEEAITFEERYATAGVCMTKLEMEPMPALIDDMQNTVGGLYSGHPDRLFLVGKDGNMAFSGDRGPFGFRPDDLEAAIRKELGLE